MLGLLASIFTAGLHVTSLTLQPLIRGAPICMKQTTRLPATKGFAAKKKASKPAPVEFQHETRGIYPTAVVLERGGFDRLFNSPTYPLDRKNDGRN